MVRNRLAPLDQMKRIQSGDINPVEAPVPKAVNPTPTMSSNCATQQAHNPSYSSRSSSDIHLLNHLRVDTSSPHNRRIIEEHVPARTVDLLLDMLISSRLNQTNTVGNQGLVHRGSSDPQCHSQPTSNNSQCHPSSNSQYLRNLLNCQYPHSLVDVRENPPISSLISQGHCGFAEPERTSTTTILCQDVVHGTTPLPSPEWVAALINNYPPQVLNQRKRSDDGLFHDVQLATHRCRWT